MLKNLHMSKIRYNLDLELITKNFATMKTNDKIQITNEIPVYTAYNDWFGFIEINIYKNWEIKETGLDYTISGNVFALSYIEAINRLHEWILANGDLISEYPKSKFSICRLNGDFDKNKGCQKEEIVYTISAKKAKKLLF